MGKKSSNQPAASVGTGNASLSTLLAKKGAVDPALASLFAASVSFLLSLAKKIY